MSYSKTRYSDREEDNYRRDSRYLSEDNTRDYKDVKRSHSSRHKNDDKHRKRDKESEDYRRRRHKRSRSSSKSRTSRRKSRSRSRSSPSSDCSSVPSLRRQLMDLSSSDSSDEESKAKRALIAAKVATNEMEVLEQKDKMKVKVKEDKKKQKEILKSLETPEEKRLRRLAKKEAKDRKRKLMMGWDEEDMRYTNADNPFGDANLHKTFVWNKKYEKLGLKSVTEEEISRMNQKKMKITKQELEKVKQRRLEREREMEARVEEQSRLLREKEADQFKEWEKMEDFFHLKQAKLRSKLRISEGRAKPIDLLARYINAFGDDIGGDEETNKTEEMSVELVEPYMCLNGLRIQDLEDLEEDIKVYMTLDSQNNLQFWKDLQIIVEDELNKLKKYQTNSAVERREGINPAVTQEVVQVFKGKTPTQLKALQLQIETKIGSNEEGLDIGYWESLLSRLKAHIARARLKEMHEKNLIIRRNRLREEQSVGQQSEPIFPIIADNTDIKEEEPMASTSIVEIDEESIEQNFDEDIGQQIDPKIRYIEDYSLGQYSPKLLSMNDIESGTLIIEAEEDIKQLVYQRNKVLKDESNEEKSRTALTADEAAFEREARKGMTKEEAVFSVEEIIKQSEKQYSWSDKYRPRKPRYFNRVHTGFEWNKYNQTHYDVDNPPPKVVQGYKFNIFFPDLINKSQTPQFKITPCPENRDFAYIRFSSGPPYEDICFKIVNREWNYSYKSGFRSQFHNNILQLWFHFKRYRYRR